MTVSPDPILITDSLSLTKDSLKSLMSLRVHMDAAASGYSSTREKGGNRIVWRGREKHNIKSGAQVQV